MTELLNLQNIPGEIISGLGDDELNWVSSISNERYIWEMSPSFLDMLNSDEIHDPDLDIEIINELDKLENTGIPLAMQKHTDIYVNKFRIFLKENNLSEEFEKTPTTILNNYRYLRFFYSRLRKSDGQLYSPSSLVCIRAAILYIVI